MNRRELVIKGVVGLSLLLKISTLLYYILFRRLLHGFRKHLSRSLFIIDLTMTLSILLVSFGRGFSCLSLVPTSDVYREGVPGVRTGRRRCPRERECRDQGDRSLDPL